MSEIKQYKIDIEKIKGLLYAKNEESVTKQGVAKIAGTNDMTLNDYQKKMPKVVSFLMNLSNATGVSINELIKEV